MNRREFIGSTLLTSAAAAAVRLDAQTPTPPPRTTPPLPPAPGRIKVTGMKAIGVTWEPNSDRPYVFVKIETDQGIVGWGEGTLEGKAGATMACIEDFKDFVVGADPMQVEHIWQSMYVHSFYRAGPVMGSAISAIDQALWDIRGKALGVPVYKLLGGPLDARGHGCASACPATDRAGARRYPRGVVSVSRASEAVDRRVNSWSDPQFLQFLSQKADRAKDSRLDRTC